MQACAHTYTHISQQLIPVTVAGLSACHSVCLNWSPEEKLNVVEWNEMLKLIKQKNDIHYTKIYKCKKCCVVRASKHISRLAEETWQLNPKNYFWQFNLLFIADFCLRPSKRNWAGTEGRTQKDSYPRMSTQYLAKFNFQSVKFPHSLPW